MVDFLQEMSYMYYVSTRYAGETDSVLKLIYYFHPSYAIKETNFTTIYSIDKYALNNKTGLFVYDSGYLLIIIVAVAMIYGFLVMLKRTCKGY
jgi:hypothetical protein